MNRNTALMELPRCPTHGCSMHYRPTRTKEQQFCGTWYDCDAPGCGCSVLLPSQDLLSQLSGQSSFVPVSKRHHK